MLARLIDNEGVVWGEFPIERVTDILLAVASKPIAYKASETIEPYAPVPWDYIQFKLERKAGDGVLIYRRITPLWKS